jgi:hypothetical protein
MKTLLFIFLLGVQYMVSATPSNVKVIDYYAYYYASKGNLVCSIIKETDGTAISNQFENGNGVTCLVNLTENGLYSLNLLIASVNDDNGKNKPPLIDVSIASKSLFKDIDIGSDKVIKTIAIKKEGGKVFIDTNCGSDAKCDYTEVTKALVEDKLLKLNFVLRKPKLFETLLLESDEQAKDRIPFDITQKCDEDCGDHGVCDKGKCLCLSGYYGDDCSKSIIVLLILVLKAKEFRFSDWQVYLTFLVALLLGIILGWLIYILCSAVMKKDSSTVTREIDIMERWERGGA